MRSTSLDQLDELKDSILSKTWTLRSVGKVEEGLFELIGDHTEVGVTARTVTGTEEIVVTRNVHDTGTASEN